MASFRVSWDLDPWTSTSGWQRTTGVGPLLQNCRSRRLHEDVAKQSSLLLAEDIARSNVKHEVRVGFKMQKRPKSTFYRRVTKAARLDLDSILLDDAGGDERQSEATRGDRQAYQPPSDSSPERDRSSDECASSATPMPDIAPGRQEYQTVSHDGSDNSDCNASRGEEEHHVKGTELKELPIDLVMQVPLDFMHLVCLGVVHKLLRLWLKGNSRSRLGTATTWCQKRGEENKEDSMASSLLPPPKPLDTTGDLWQSWRIWKSEFKLFSTATMLTKKPKEVQAATFLMTIGEEARKAYATFVFEAEEERDDVNILMEKFESFYRPATNLTYNEFRFGTRDQREGETFNEWLTELRFMMQVLKLLHGVKRSQQQLSEQLALIIEVQRRAEGFATEPVGLPRIKSIEELMAFEKELEGSMKKRIELKKYMLTIGGDSPKENTSRILRKMLCHEVGAAFTWYGTKNKRAFSTLQFCQVMCDSMRVGTTPGCMAMRDCQFLRDLTDGKLINLARYL
ncbi:hypothetical protein HPB47_016342 [Ixodes persulcatus]|uniref:Uncharacterized protein n=1 Tax=Ixodes persulcatus TaxID=34615 RepID=A0AC60QR71_IXOPE|nr:hypothetical protein HPB47_016342 [Ixodes persulcatus]